jgi:heat shock protein HslJ
MKRFLFPLLLIGLLLASCNTNKNMDSDSPFDPAGDRQELISADWNFQTIYGQDIAAAEGRTTPHLKFTEDGQVQGHTGCNPITGTYTLEDGLRIRFSDMATGMAFCGDEVGYESDLLEVLNQTDNYTLNDGVLSLNKARMAPMATLIKANK